MIASAFFAISSFALELQAPVQAQDPVRERAYKMSRTKKTILSYRDARLAMFGEIYLENDSTGNQIVKDVYCEKIFNQTNAGVGPHAMPNQEKLNCEHTWPQSKFYSPKENSPLRDEQTSDLHHLFPADKKANMIRGNNDFADVIGNLNLGGDCKSSKSGQSRTGVGSQFFEPPVKHKGNVARAMFYFSTYYRLPIDTIQEEVLRSWHKLDPVDENEKRRNTIIESIQGNRNPFIDYPELVARIKDF